MAARPLPALVLLLAAGATHAQAIHKCRDAEGRVAYQDQPCPVEALPLPPIDGPPSDPYVPDLASTATPASPTDVSAAPPTAPPPPLPQRFACTRENGETYVSDNPVAPVRYVPAWAVGATTTTSNLPRSPARQDWDRRVGGAYVRVQDQCTPMGRRALCAHWRSALDAARSGARTAFAAERETLDRQVADLRESLRVHCGA
jgi:hypothetical protein